MSRRVTLKSHLDRYSAQHFTSLVPEGCEPDQIDAWITDYDGSVAAGFIVYWRGKHSDGTPHKRRTSATFGLTKSWASMFGLSTPPTVDLLEDAA